MRALIFHIPHASVTIPPDCREGIALSDAALAEEIRVLTDHFSDELFGSLALPGDHVILCPVSRLVVDVERFADDDVERMSQRGMGAVYTHGHAGKTLRTTLADRDDLMQRFHAPHHAALAVAVRDHLHRHGAAFILDCHSYPQCAQPYELDQDLPRPEIGLGTDPFHTPAKAVSTAIAVYDEAGFSVLEDTPFAGSIVPSAFFRQDPRVHSMMIELRRDIYMDEQTSQMHDGKDRLLIANAALVLALRQAELK
jgi:N-formylglutamate deformylase